jgi:hypothetical protein
MDAQMTQTIDLTPTWAGLLPALVALTVNSSTDEGRETAQRELQRMAQVADRANLWQPIVTLADALVTALSVQDHGTLTPDSMLALEALETALGEATQ